MVQENLHAFFHPQTVAVIGASATPGKVGHTIVANMLGAGFAGTLLPVNPKGGEVLGLPVTASMADLPKGLDLAVIALPRGLVLDAVRDLAALRTRSVIVLTAGFKEVGKEGWYLEQDLKQICRESGMVLLGPNCLGMINTAAGVNASFSAGQPHAGPIAFFSQSGALCVAILDWARGQAIGFSKFVSLGNKAALDEADMLEYLADDPGSRVILGYLENVENGEKFLERAAKVCRAKPVVMIKSGTTAAGAKAASSHTGAIAGSDQAYEAAFRKAGIIRVHDVEALFNLAEAFSNQPLPRGPNLGIVTNSGGPGILAADATESSSLNLARPSTETLDRLAGLLPPYAALYNPVDILGDADAERYGRALEIVADDPRIHALLVLLAPTADADIEGTARAIIRVAARRPEKPVFTCFMGKLKTDAGMALLKEAGIPCYGFPEPAVRSLAAMYEYFLARQAPVEPLPDTARNLEAAAAVIAGAEAKGATEIVEFQAQEILRAYGLPTPRTRLARSTEEALAAAEEIGYPVVMKIASPDISHKSDVGGVRVNVRDEADVRRTFWDITSRAQKMRREAFIVGCLVQEMAAPGSKEVIIGFKRDDQFGSLLMFGLGGIYVEVLKDIAFRLAPMTRGDAFKLVREIKSYMLLKGLRGEASVDFHALEEIVLAMSRLAVDFPQVVEAEFNPVLVGPGGAVVADVRLTLRQGGET